ncbi:YfhO family protein [Fructilactobacillus ixorae]|uniref:YfhO family protein n=1 Tax=Fructilactobacillus ixorae TaxID=1750535 RepID=A0ABY5C7C6_9LACO|nr:YfhO family protein [Fructilactobacillus ixorae]USS93211.1 YfhO family protein [Fructilactobacillus ixorae]
MKMLKKLPTWVLYTILFAIIVAVFGWTFYLTDRSLIWSMDGIAQHYPILVNFRELLVNFLAHPSHGLTHWSVDLGLGADQLTSFSYYVIGDLFNYLIVFFPKGQIEFGYGVLVLLRLYCAGLAFLVYLHNFHLRKISRLISTLTYTFSSFALYAGMHHAFFLLPLIFFPLLAAGIERVLRHQSSWLLCGAVFITFLSNFYFAYMLGLGCLIYVTLRSLMVRKARWFHWGRFFLRLTVTVGLGMLAAAVLFIPTMLYAFQSTRITGDFANGYRLYPLSYYLNLPSKLLGLGGPFSFWLIIGLSGISLYALVYVLLHFKRYRYLNVALLLVGAGLCLPAVSAIFNAFASPSNRWLALALLPVGLATAIFVNHLTRLTRRDVLTLGISTLGLLVLIWASQGFLFRLQRHDVIEYVLLFGLLACCWLARDDHWNPRTLYLSVLTIVTLNLIALGLGYYSPNNSGFSRGMLRQQSAAHYTQNYYDGADHYVTKRLGNARTSIGPRYHYFPLERAHTFNIDYFNASSNLPLNLQTHDIASYLTLENGFVGQLEQAIRNNQFTPNDPVAQNDYRSTMLSLMGVKYLFLNSAQRHYRLPAGFKIIKNQRHEPRLFKNQNQLRPADQATGTILAQNQNALPLLYSQRTAIHPATWNRLGPVEKEQSQLQGAVVASPGNRVRTITPRQTSKSLAYTTNLDDQDWITTFDQLATSKWGQDANRTTTPDQHYTSKARAKDVLSANDQRKRAVQHQNRTGLHELNTDVLGKPQPVTLKLKHPAATRNTELYLELDGIHASASSPAEQQHQAQNQAWLRNQSPSPMDHLNEWRQGLQTSNNGSFKLTAHTTGMSNAVTQLGTDELSNYVPKRNAVLNLGYAPKARSTITLHYQGASRLRFNRVRVIAVPMGKAYQQRLHQLQTQRLRHIKLTPNQITGTSKQPRPTVLTTSIPYSKGWQLFVDNHPVATQRVNTGFVGGIIPAGTHQIRLQYRTPGLGLGLLLTLISGILVLGIGFLSWLLKHRKHS